jgi:oligoribonuclease (3'-5' exoribonuclease)
MTTIIAALIIVTAGFFAVYNNMPIVEEYLILKRLEVSALQRIAAALERKP